MSASMLACFGHIGRLEKTVIDCPDPRALAEFYCEVLGMSINEDIGSWVVIGSGPGLRQLAFQQAADWVPPRWPDPAHPQQMHLDIRVSDADQTGPSRTCSPWALSVSPVNAKRASGSSPTPSGTPSASFSVAPIPSDRAAQLDRAR